MSGNHDAAHTGVDEEPRPPRPGLQAVALALVAVLTVALAVFVNSGDPALPEPAEAAGGVDTWAWTRIADEQPWRGRAGLHVVELDGAFLLMGGRTPERSTVPGAGTIWGDVWRSTDRGRTWEVVREQDRPGAWAPRAYFQAVAHDGYAYVLGGQDFRVVPSGCPAGIPGCPPEVPTSTFFNDVWRSRDGVEWERRTDAAPWAGRSGLRAVSFDGWIWIFGGSRNDDSAVVGAQGPVREYFNDVWRSRDGSEWEQVTGDAPWAPRAGAVVVVRDGELYLLGGEAGFTCTPLPDCEPPYFNDVWRSADGAEWEQVTEAAGWSPRPGHQCVVTEEFICFGGFGLEENPSDVWTSSDGRRWRLVSEEPWNAQDPTEVRYDFEAFSSREGGEWEVFTFGGDRETFDFTDPTNYTRVDDDVWRFGPAHSAPD
ncbi:MAG: hypothetical protein ACKO2C_01050 [Actinomycetes bacterium]